MDFKYSREEHLKSKKIIENLYKNGKSIKKFPLRMVYLKNENKIENFHKIGVSVPKRNFKKAVDRNKLKRKLRESYRLQKDIIYAYTDERYVFMISYIAREHWSQEQISEKMLVLLKTFINEISNNEF